MTDFLDRIGNLSPKRLALLAMEQQDELERLRSRVHEPLAIVGMGCRFPGGAESPAAYWELLDSGKDAIVDMPAERWDIERYFDADVDAPGRMGVTNGGFLRDIGGFDAGFFGISPREAMTLDPQQRLMLEVVWEALEDAGIAPQKLSGSRAGVFLGLCNSDHFQRLLRRGPESIDAYLASGNAPSVAAGRIAYFLGLHGPALTVDTACSSSLVALHLACRSLRAGDCEVALAAGVNVMCAPEITIALTKSHMLAPDGRCKTFDADADGFARGEGCGVLVLKRLSDARRDGDRVLALIRGTAINQDGRSGGLTVPNGPAQEAVIRAALEDGAVAAGDIDYVEAHGTGTSLGDPIEVRAIGNALASGRSAADPLWIGSVKTNIGHLESAAGIAGVIKVVLALMKERLPPHLHLKSPSPRIDWERHAVRVAPEGRAWTRGERRRLAGVSSFGFSGTNAHVIIEEAPASPTRQPAASRPLYCLPLSARTEPALREVAIRHAAALEALDPGAFADYVHTAGVGRNHLGERAAVLCATAEEAIDALRALGDGRPHDRVQRGTVATGFKPEIAFLFTGQGSQYPGMGRGLYEHSDVFRACIDRCDELLGADAAGLRLKSVLFGSAAETAAIHSTRWTQPALFALETALTLLWRSWGIEPAAVLGHSVGEYAAACAAGVFSLEDGLQLIATRGQLMEALPPGGAMAAVFAPPEAVEAVIEPYASQLSIAAVNAPDSVVISGDARALDSALEVLATRQIQGRKLLISLAAHSPLVEPALAPLRSAAAKVTMSAPSIPVAWNAAGTSLRDDAAPTPDYWCSHLREPVMFAAGAQRLRNQGLRVLLEVGPHPTLVALAQRITDLADADTLASLRRGQDDWREILTALARLYVLGASIDWAGVGASGAPRRLALPTYPFQRDRYWVPLASPSVRAPDSRANGLRPVRMQTAVPLFELHLLPSDPAYLAAHRVQGAVLVAGPVLAQIGIHAFQSVVGSLPAALHDFIIREPLVLPVEGRRLQVELREIGGGFEFTLHSRSVEGEGTWRSHAAGKLMRTSPPLVPSSSPAERLQASARDSRDGADHYRRLAALGMDLGAAFRTICAASINGDEAFATLELPSEHRGTETGVHPVLLDGVLQTVGLTLPEADDRQHVYLLASIGSVRLPPSLPDEIGCHVRLRPVANAADPDRSADVTVWSTAGELLGAVEGITLRRTSPQQLAGGIGVERSDRLYHELDWEPSPVRLAASAGFVPVSALLPTLQERFDALARDNGMDVYGRLLPTLDRLSASYIAKALRRLGFDDTPGRVFAEEDEFARLGVVPEHRRLFARLLRILEEESTLRHADSGWTIESRLPMDDIAALEAAASREFAATDGELSMLSRCGASLAEVLNGSQDPLQLLFPGGSFAEARKLYVESPYARTYNRALADALDQMVGELQPGATLRILEIGAGTGGTTTYALPRVSARCSEYWFTDLSPLFLERAAETFGEHACLRTGILDIERGPAGQGYANGTFDVVIAANVLHATQDMHRTLQHVRSLLAPGGAFLLLEGVAPERWVDLTFGLTDGWWRFTDLAVRPSYPLLSRDGWKSLLEQVGFDGMDALPSAAVTARGLSQQALIVSKAAVSRRRFAVVGAPAGSEGVLEEILRARQAALRIWPAGTDVGTAALDADEVVVFAGSDSRELLDAFKSASASPPGTRLWVVTRGAQPVNSDPDIDPHQALWWGAARVFALEYPDCFAGIVDLDASLDPASGMEALVTSLYAADDEDQVAWRNGVRHVPRLHQRALPHEALAGFDPEGLYLVTGAFGGIGRRLCHWLVDQGARNLGLLGRSAPDVEFIEELAARGVTATAASVDVGDESALRELFDRWRDGPPLRGVLHAAADLSAAPLAELTDSQFAAMCRPKVDGTEALERLTRDTGCRFIVLFSSSTSVLGASGFLHYAAANQFMDAFAWRFDRPERRILSINWGTWDAMRLASESERRGFVEAGLLPMSSESALDALGRVLAAGPRPQALVAAMEWGVLRALHESRRTRPMLSGLVETTVGKGAEAPLVDGGDTGDVSLRALLDQALPSQREEVLVGYVQAQVADVLALGEPGRVPLTTGLFDLGMDSLMAVELKRRLEQGAGRTLPSTLTFNYPNVAALAGFLASELGLAIGSAAPSSGDAAAAEQDADHLDALSEQELEARLLAQLEDFG